MPELPCKSTSVYNSYYFYTRKESFIFIILFAAMRHLMFYDFIKQIMQNNPNVKQSE